MCTILRYIMKSFIISLCLAQDVNHSFVQGIHAVDVTLQLVTSYLDYPIDSHSITMLVLK